MYVYKMSIYILNVWFPSWWNYLVRIRRCGLIKGSVFLGVDHSQQLSLSLSAFCLYIGCTLSATAPVPDLPACSQAPFHDGHRFTL